MNLEAVTEDALLVAALTRSIPGRPRGTALRGSKIRFTQSLIEDAALNAAFKPQLDCFAQASLSIISISALRHHAYHRAGSNPTARSIAANERLEVNFE
jgi:hypothetical protein